MMAKEISQQLALRAEDTARYLFPNGKKEGNEWRVGSVEGETGRSLGVHLIGEKAGVWCDFANGGGGDLLDLWVEARKLSLPEAIKEARSYLGISKPQFYTQNKVCFSKPIFKAQGKLSYSSPVLRYLVDERKLLTKTLEAYKIGEKNQQIVFPFLRGDLLVSIKYLNLERIEGKKQIKVEPNCEPCLFGWHLIPQHTRTITLCEGEIDAMSLYQYGVPALSLPFGGGKGEKHKWIEYEFDRLSMFDEIYLCFDNDSVGQVTALEVMERLGRHRCRIVELPYKDANECLQRGVSLEVMQLCFKSAKTLDPEELKSAYSYVGQVVDGFYPAQGISLGYELPWEKAKNNVLFRPGELSIWTGFNGHGKSQFLGQVILHNMAQGARVCIASLELKPSRLLMRLTRQAGAIEKPSIEYIEAIHKWYEDKLWLFDLVGTAKSKRLLEVFLYAHQRYGIDVFVIDSLMKLDVAEDDFNAQKIFIDQLCDFKNQYNCHIHLVAHPRKSTDESIMPGKLDIKGSGTISDLADNCFTVWRNKQKEQLKQIQNGGFVLIEKDLKKLEEADCLWRCDKQRNGDWEGRLGFWFNNKTLQYLDHPTQKPIRIVDYSRYQ